MGGEGGRLFIVSVPSAGLRSTRPPIIVHRKVALLHGDPSFLEGLEVPPVDVRVSSVALVVCLIKITENSSCRASGVGQFELTV